MFSVTVSQNVPGTPEKVRRSPEERALPGLGLFTDDRKKNQYICRGYKWNTKRIFVVVDFEKKKRKEKRGGNIQPRGCEGDSTTQAGYFSLNQAELSYTNEQNTPLLCINAA